MKTKLAIFRLILLGSAFVWAGSLHAFTWDISAKSDLEFVEGLNRGRPLMVVDADSAGHALVVASYVSEGPQGFEYRLHQPGQGWSDWTFLDFEGEPGSFDASMAANGNYCIAGVEFNTGMRLWVDLVVGGVTVANQFLAAITPSITEPRTAVSANGDALVAWGNSFDHQVVAKLYRGGAWQPDVVLDGVDIRSLAVAAEATGNFVAVWNPNGEPHKIYCRRFVGGAWAARELIGQSAAGGEEQWPSVGMHGVGNIVVAWRHQFLTHIGIHNGAAVRRFNGSSWSAVERVDNVTNILGPPDLAVQPDGKAMVLFQHEVGAQAEGPLYANRFNGSNWGGPVEIGCGLQGAKMGVDMDGNGNAVVAFKSGTTFYWHAYQEGIGWLGCSAQGRGSQPNVMAITAPEFRQKTVALTPHEIIGTWSEASGISGLGRRYVNVAGKDVRINGYALEASSRIVDISVRLPYNDICGNQNPAAFQQMRFSNDGTQWSPWEPYTATKMDWDLANPTYGGTLYGGTAASGLKYVYVAFRNANCESIVTHDEILFTGGITIVDAGLRAYDGGSTPVRIACELRSPLGELVSPLRFFNQTAKYGIPLVNPGSPNASRILIHTDSGPKAWAKLP